MPCRRWMIKGLGDIPPRSPQGACLAADTAECAPCLWCPMHIHRVFDDGRHKAWLEIEDRSIAFYMDVDGVPFSVNFDVDGARVLIDEIRDLIGRLESESE